MAKCWRLSLVLVVFVVGMTTAQQMDDTSAMSYLKKYAYMGSDNPDPKMASLTDSKAFPMAIKSFQTMHGLNVTGLLDNETMTLMEMPRCGNKDVMNMEDNSMSMKRKRRYAVQGSKWPKTQLTYRIKNYTPDMSRTDVANEIKRAFSVWEMVTPLSFTITSGTPDIDIEFGAYEHGDGNPFDGPSGTLAHAYFPQYGGNSHFDESETWTINTYSGINLFQVAAHEFGHALGLSHSNINAALMAPFYRGYQPSFQLHEDDINGIQRIYGKPTTTNPTTTTTTRSPGSGTTRSTTRRPTVTTTTQQPNVPDIKRVCDAGRFDAISLHVVDGQEKTFGFYQDLYMEISDQGIAPGYPKKISQGWPGLPDNVDAAIYYEAEYSSYWSWNGRWTIVTRETAPARTYFFKGSQYWRFENGKKLSDYPRSISRYWGGLPNNMDAAFKWSYNGKEYFIKGNQYYRLGSNGRVDANYPRPLAVWDNALTSVDSSFQSNMKTYFFVGSQYYRYDDSRYELETGYPLSTSVQWMGCNRFRDLLQNQVNSAPSSLAATGGIIMSSLIVAVVSIILH